MKKIILLSLLFAFLSASSQIKLTEKQVIHKSHIDFSKEVIAFQLNGLIEIDGHTFLNDTCKIPIMYTANLSEVMIFRGITYYSFRRCQIADCKVIHLVVKGNANMYIKPSNLYYNVTGL